jgi:DNA-binding transcriptional LysR family regulator
VELYQIRYFLALCETLNFARAAERCHVSQPSLTRAIQKLEGELGGLLIRRERRRTHLTELGELTRPMLQEIQAQTDRIKATAKRHLNQEKKTLRLGVLPSIGPLRFARFFAQVSEDAGIELQLDEAPMPALCDLMFRGELNAAVVVAHAERIDDRLRCHPLYRERLVCAMLRDHPLARRDSVRLRDLEGQNFLMRTNCESKDLILENCRQQGLKLHIAYRSGREDWVQAMVAAGCGVTIMPEFCRSLPEIATRPLINPELVREIALATVAGRPHGQPIACILRALCARKWGDAEVHHVAEAKSVELRSRPVDGRNSHAVRALN